MYMYQLGVIMLEFLIAVERDVTAYVLLCLLFVWGLQHIPVAMGAMLAAEWQKKAGQNSCWFREFPGTVSTNNTITSLFCLVLLCFAFLSLLQLFMLLHQLVQCVC
jgi:hypothetical protein